MSDQVPNVNQELAELRNSNVVMQLEMARMAVYADHPHLRGLGLLEEFQGSPDQIRAFGARLAERFPAPAPTPAPLTQQPPAPGQPAAPVPPVVQPAPQPGTSAQPPAPVTSAVPTPAAQDVLTQNSADVARADEIREKMSQGIATRQEVIWLSQNAPSREVDLGNGLRGMSGGFVSAVQGLRRGR